jgi:uncharacterized membrane protein YphA (DoxX/SURF4 family)
MANSLRTNGSAGIPSTSISDRFSEQPGLDWLTLAVRLFLGTIFLVSGAEKLANLETFGHAIANYQMLPDSLTNLVAVLFVWTEITIAILLISGAAIRGSGFVAGGLLSIFLIAILSAMARGLEIDCGCFAPGAGVQPEKVGWPKVFEDLAMLAGAFYLIYFPKSPLSIDRLLRRQGANGEVG